MFIKEILQRAKEPHDGIFLSHSSADKVRIRDYYNTLKQLGYNPWLDEDAMSAGTPLERALLDGMKTSMAAVFFITPEEKTPAVPELLRRFVWKQPASDLEGLREILRALPSSRVPRA